MRWPKIRKKSQQPTRYRDSANRWLSLAQSLPDDMKLMALVPAELVTPVKERGRSRTRGRLRAMAAVGEAFMDSCKHLAAGASKKCSRGMPTSTGSLPQRSGVV